MPCAICYCKDSKYKCPNCRISYCSLQCWNEHKKTPCKVIKEEEPSVIEEKPRDYDYKTEDTVSLEKLKLLERSTILQQILKNQHLRELLTSIDNSSNPGQAMKLAMQEPLFVEFADECLKIVEPLEDAPP
ncbi:hypothetical protein L9F63_015950 [Diploptera punctata]|uniref:HIT-type domain-containing protein n=1 Tax=Diploptera punctata TaxID=6984 RepID=A0AAD8A5Z1_DIPPU|nr:hypothetical protein L9F63_015950 [Diploptera punctata]